MVGHPFHLVARRDLDAQPARRHGRGAPAGGTREAVDDGDRGDADAAAARLLQVLRVLLAQPHRGGQLAGAQRRAAADPGDPAGRRVVLLVHGGELHRRRVPGSHHGRELDRRVPVPVVLPPPGGGADRAPRRADPPAGRAARPSPRRRGGRVVADLRRVVQEGGDLQLPGEHDGGSGVRQPRVLRRDRRAGRDRVLRDRDLRRLQRLHRHRDRHRQAPRVPVPPELRPALQRPEPPGLLATVAHHACPAGSATTCTSRSAVRRRARCAPT